MDEKNQFFSLYNRLKEKYGMENEDILDLIEFATNLYMSLRNDYSIQTFTPYELSWIKRACFEIKDREKAGIIAGVESYSENGYSYSQKGSAISDSLAYEITPKVGVVSYDS